MPESTIQDPTDAGTLRPAEKPLEKHGTHFIPIDCPQFDMELDLPDEVSPNDPITLFTQYYTPEMLDRMVEATNTYEKQSKDLPYSRAAKWYPTTRNELYLYFAFLIYMTIYLLNKIEDYWNTKRITPFHDITRCFSRDRLIELCIRFRIAHPDIDDDYQKVEPFNSHV